MRLIDADRLQVVLEKNFGHTGGASVLEQLINEQPTIRPIATDTNVGDTISRQAAIDALDCISGVEEVLRSLPTIQPQSTTGQLNDGVRSTARSTDLIDRGQAIEKFTMTAPQMSVIRIYEAVEILESMPTIQPEPQWIPVSERLPEDMQFVLLTVRRLKNEYNPGPFISVGYIGWNQQHWWCAHDGDCEISKVEVIAWMPLPEAYKPNK